MYSVSVIRDFIAQHYLIGGDWGAENLPHGHHYRLELELSGESLDQHAYLVDIVAIEAILNDQISQYRNRLLNDLAAFRGVNPSLEFFARLMCESIARQITAVNVRKVKVRLWENEWAWAGYELEV